MDQIAAKAVVDADVLAVILVQVAEDSQVVLVDQAVAVTLVALVDQEAEVTQVAQAVQEADSQVVLVDQVVAVTLVALVDQVAEDMLVVLKEEAVGLTVVVDSVRKAKAEIVHAVKENRSVETANDHKFNSISRYKKS